MIGELKRLRMTNEGGKEVWLIPDLWLALLRVQLPVGERYEVYNPAGHPYASEGTEDGAIGALRSATVVAPGGRVKVHNDLLEQPSTWEGSLSPVCNGVFIKAKVEFEAEIPSTLLCASPPGDLSRFAGKQMRRETVLEGQSYTFKAGDIGYAGVYGDGEMRGFSVEAGDVLTVGADSVIAVVSEVD